MSWFNQFDTSGFASLAKTALKEAQKTIDKALDIKDEDDSDEAPAIDPPLEVDDNDSSQKISKLGSSLWSSFTNSVFESQDDLAEKQNEMRQSMSLDLSTSTVKSEAVVANQPVRSCSGPTSTTRDDQFNVIELDSEPNVDVVHRTHRESCSSANRLSAVSCDSDRKSTVSTDSVEVLGSTSTTTPESSVEVITSSSVEVLDIVAEPNRTNEKQYSPDAIEPIPELVEDEDSLTCSISDNVTCMPNEETILPHHAGMLMLKSTTSSLDISLTDLSSPHENSGALNILEEETTESIGSQNTLHPQETPFKTTDDKKNAQSPSNTLNPSSSTTDLLKVSDTTLESSSCDDETMVGSALDEVETTDSGDDVREQSPHVSVDNHSDFVKIGSSGTNSCDELETWTSSDIEVISSPATNEDSESNASHRQSPVKYQPYNLTSFLSGHQQGTKDFEDLQKKVVELNSIVKARESKLIDLSKKNAELAASNSDMKSQIDYLNSSHLNEEYTQRLATMEKKFQQAIREKDQLQKQLDQNKNAAQFKNLIEDKDTLIKELRDEGEKLSIQHLNLNNIIKKLRAAEKESQKSINKYKEQQEKSFQELERIKKSLVAKEEMERSQIEAIHQLTKTNQNFEKENISLQSQVDNLTSTLVSLQKNIQDKENIIIEFKKSAKELKLVEDNKQNLEDKLAEKNKQCEQMDTVISNLKSNLCKIEENKHMVMNDLKQENLSLIRRLEESERKLQNSLQETFRTTQPLVKELEEKSNILKALESDFEKREQLQLKTIGNLQATLESSEHKFKMMDAKINEANISIKKYKEQIENFLKSDNNLKADIEKLKEENRVLKLKLDGFSKLENEAAGNRKQLADAALRNHTLENELKLEKEKCSLEVEKRKKLQNEMQTQQLVTSHVSHQSSPSTSVGVPSLEESSFWPSFADDDRSSVTERAGSVYDSMRPSFSNTTTILENLQSQIKLKEGEAQQLQWELSRRDHERDQLTTELAALTVKVEEQSASLAELLDLQRRYDALLQLYGEKLEECDELKLDLQDVKDMYKAQIDELLKRDKTG